MRQASTRIIVNTTAQYSRSLVSIVVALYSTRLVLKALGQEEYGIYALVAGVVAMLAFISNALVTTTQRYLSFHQGRSEIQEMRQLWSNIIILHIGFSFILIFILEGIGPLLFNGFLNITPEKISSAKYVYQCCILMVILSFLSSPFLALLISHENIVYSSIIQVCDSILRLLVAIIITNFGFNKLELYVSLLCCISILDLILYSTYTFHKYPECGLPHLKHLHNKIIRSISSFLFWQIYSTGCIVGRTQGCAIVLNKFFGAIINTSFGIAQQVSGAISFVSGALLNAINPQIIKAEGEGDRGRMFRLAMTASKFSFFLLSMVVVPLTIDMPKILELWLGELPEDVVLFCRVILLTALIDQTTIGLGTANQAIGNVRNYSLTVNTIKLLTVPCLAFLLYKGIDIKIAIWIYALMEFICALCRIPFLKITGGLNIHEYVKRVFIPILIPLCILCLGYIVLNNLTENFYIFIIGGIFLTILYSICIYNMALSPTEIKIADRIINRLKP
jgi:hypothetical protein